MRGHCEKEVGVKVAAFTTFLENNKDQEQPNLTAENVELLTKFASFLQQEKHGKYMHMGGHYHKHGKFGRHGHHGIFGHHFGRHGPHGRHGHGPWPCHGHSQGKHGKHGFEHGKDFEHGTHFGKHHKTGKHFWKRGVYRMDNQTIVIEDDDCAAERNPSTPPQENAAGTAAAKGPSDGDNGKCACERKGRHCGRRWRRNEWALIRGVVDNTDESALNPPKQNTATDANDQPQENLVTGVENITIENATPKE